MRFINPFIVLLLIVAATAPSHSQNYIVRTDSVPGDPLQARIYTLSNGLTVCLSVNKRQARFQSMIAVKAGSKNDPANATGLAHYLEHMLFKGNQRFGTLDYAAEKPYLDSIYTLYDQYGKSRDSLERKRIYREIDRISLKASSYAIPNEYDKVSAALGASGINAYTSFEQTVYLADVPANQMENYFELEGERFHNPVMRLFHTELEAVYEEKNQSTDNNKLYEALFKGLFPTHTYGTQTTIGTTEHLKNPSLREIQNYLDTYYVPNNMIIAVSGDIQPEATLAAINKAFSWMKPAPVNPYQPPVEKLIKAPLVREVYGPDPESVRLGFRFPGAASPDADLLTMVDMILSNGVAGLIDLNLNGAQKVIGAYSSTYILSDYSVHFMGGKPKGGQSLEEVKQLLLDQIMEIKNGNFPDWLIPAVVTNLKLDQQKSFEDNYSRTSFMIDYYLNGVDYASQVARIDRLSRITKQQIIDFVRTWYGDNYVVVYKRTGEDENEEKIVKPDITPVQLNASAVSPFAASLTERMVESVEADFVDFQNDIQKKEIRKGIELYAVNTPASELFYLRFVVPVGSNHLLKMRIASALLPYLGTPQYNANRVKEELYKLGCSFQTSTGAEETVVSINGLQEQFIPSLILMEHLLDEVQADDNALKNVVADQLKQRADAKQDKRIILSAMDNYARYGATNPFKNILSESELKALTAQELVTMIHNLKGYVHRIDYSGPMSINEVENLLRKYHKTPKLLQNPPVEKKFTEQEMDSNRVFFMHYPIKQAEILMLSRGAKYNPALYPEIRLYNQYFSGSMASPVFQVLRESKALAYMAYSDFRSPSRPDYSYYRYSFVGTQSDKMEEAIRSMNELLNEFPGTEDGIEREKSGLKLELETERIHDMQILDLYHRSRKMGVDHDLRYDLYTRLPSLNLEAIQKFHFANLKGLKSHTVIMGNEAAIDQKMMSKFGTLQLLGLDELFGY